MELQDNKTNRAILYGNLPTEKLLPCRLEKEEPVDLKALAQFGIALYSKQPDIFNVHFDLFYQKATELVYLDEENVSYAEQDINCLINTSFEGYSLNVKLTTEADNLKPFVTPLDKVLWYGARVYQEVKEACPNVPYDAEQLMYTWVYLLQLAQNMETATGLTVDYQSDKYSIDVFHILMTGLDNAKNKTHVRRLTQKELNGLNSLQKARKSLRSNIELDQISSKEVADKTDDQWAMFLELVNDLAMKEMQTIKHILEARTPREKIGLICDYTNALSNIESGKYFLRNEEINLLSLFSSMSERVQKAPYYLSARPVGGDPFVVFPTIFTLVIDAKSFNYLLVTYHLFRLSPNKDNAKKFFSAALSCICHNLGSQKPSAFTIEEMIQEFYQLVSTFEKDNHDTLANLSLNYIQPNAVFASSDIINMVNSSNLIRQEMRSIYDAKTTTEKTTNGIDYCSITKPHDKNEVLAEVKDFTNSLERLTKKAKALPLVSSLDIIYLFCDALRIVLTNQRVNIKLKHKDKVEQYRGYLLRLDEKLVHSVYGEMDENEMGMLERREKIGVVSTTLTELEAQVESFRNEQFSNIMKTTIEELVFGIEELECKQILDRKLKIRKAILQFPACDEKEYYAEWLDSISARISRALTEKSKKEKDDYHNIQKVICTSLGELSSILPTTVIDSLTTAEMLFKRYAKLEFAKQGFDYSCISALYYQAFEDAYNQLIWSGYADMLNQLLCNGKKYTDILKENDNYHYIREQTAKGYLFESQKKRAYYLNKDGSIKNTCMYSSFSSIMETVRKHSELDKFCEYFSKTAGFRNQNEMLSDYDYLKVCSTFSKAIDDSANRRNNASHGGTLIKLDDCKDDKRIVLNNLESIRDNAIGLIQQLLYLLRKRVI